MQVTVDSPSALGRRLRVRIPEERVVAEVDKRIGDLARSISLPGFRPGRAPLKIVRRRFGGRIRNEVVGEIVRSSLGDALAQEQLRPAGPPAIDPLESARGQGVDYTATFDVYPTVTLRPFDQIEICKPRAHVKESDVERMIDTLRHQRRRWETADREAETGDRVIVDYQGSVDGEPLEHGRGEAVRLEIGSGNMIPGFEEGLVGIRAGEERSLTLTFPPEYADRELAGKAAEFKVKAQQVEEAVLPDLDDAFATGFGVREGGMEAFRDEVRGNMQRELDDGLRILTKQRVLEALLGGEDIDLPAGLVDEEVRRAMERRHVELEHSGVAAEQAPPDPSRFAEAAKRRVTLGLLMAEIAEVHHVQLDSERVRERIEAISSTYEEEDADKVTAWYYSNPERLSHLESMVLEDQIVEKILGEANVSEEVLSFDQVLNPGHTATMPQP